MMRTIQDSMKSIDNLQLLVQPQTKTE